MIANVAQPVTVPVSGRIVDPFGRREAITAAPAKVSGVYPADGATNLQLDTVITWDRPARAQWYDVYIGATAETLVKVGDAQAARTFVLTLALGSTYYLRIDAGNSIGTTTGDVTSFSTWASADILLDGDGVPVTDGNGGYIEVITA